MSLSALMNHAVKSLHNPKAYNSSAFALETSFLPEKDAQILRETIFLQCDKAIRAERTVLANLTKQRCKAFRARMLLGMALIGIWNLMGATWDQPLRLKSQRSKHSEEAWGYCILGGLAIAHFKSYRGQTHKIAQIEQEKIAKIHKVSRQMLNAISSTSCQAGNLCVFSRDVLHAP